MKKKTFTKLAYDSANDMIYGVCPNPVTTKHGVVVGGGEIVPELNFTLPTMAVNDSTIKDACKIYSDMINGVLKRCVDLHQESVIVEYETLPDFTEHPEYGTEVVKIILDAMNEYNAKYGLKAALRATPNDMREMTRPPVMRSGSKYWDGMLQLFDNCAELGADFLSIESTGGKELDDEALVEADIRRVIFALGVCSCRDMEFLWDKMVDVCDKSQMIPGGDSSCGFANTAMVLADRGFIPKTFAAVVRVATVPRALIPYERGAYGPSKDCEYAGPYIKAITGAPIAMEGKSASGAHLSAVGNIAGAVADMWSNESIQQVRLLSDMAPVVGMEQLIYDCRLMNTAAKMGKAKDLRDMLVESDAPLDVQAYVLRPDVVFDLSQKIITSDDPLIRTKIACAETVKVLQSAIEDGKVACDERDEAWLDMMADAIDEIPDTAEEFYEDIKDELDETKYRPEEYLLTK
jgi:methanol--5-hydroxybenzimidazolylcobamide Co-methyltransferase